MIWHQRTIEANVFQKVIPHIRAFRCFTFLQGYLSMLIYLPQSSLLLPSNIQPCQICLQYHRRLNTMETATLRDDFWFLFVCGWRTANHTQII